MKVLIMGHGGHGKSTLAKAIMELSNQNIECIEVDTNSLLEITNKKQIAIEALTEIQKNKLNMIECRGSKKNKNWQRNNFWQK